MTQILTCLTEDVVVVASDRRLIDLNTGDVLDDEACKLIFVGGQALIAYTGLANLKPPPRGQTDLWIWQTLTPPPNRLPEFTEVLGNAASDRFSRISHLGPRAKRHTFVMAGWDREGEGDPFSPFALTLSNAEGEDGGWQERATHPSRFIQITRRLMSDYRTFVAGQPLHPDDEDELNEALKNPANRSPAAVASLLGTTIRRSSQRNPAVGRGLLVGVLPTPVESGTGGFQLSPISSPPAADLEFPSVHEPTAFYVPSDANRGVIAAPHLVQRGLALADVQIHNRAMPAKEIKRVYEEGLKKLS